MSSGVVSVCYRDFLFLFVKVLNKAGLTDMFQILVMSFSSCLLYKMCSYSRCH